MTLPDWAIAAAAALRKYGVTAAAGLKNDGVTAGDWIKEGWDDCW